MPWAGFLGFVFGLYTIYSDLWFVGGFITLFSFLAMVLREGVGIDQSKKRIRFYWGLLGVRFGTWEPLDPYRYLVILRSEGTYEDHWEDIPAGAAGAKIINYDLYLMSANHLKRFMLVTVSTQKEALEVARDISEKLGLEFVKYNPGQTVHQKRY